MWEVSKPFEYTSRYYVYIHYRILVPLKYKSISQRYNFKKWRWDFDKRELINYAKLFPLKACKCLQSRLSKTSLSWVQKLYDIVYFKQTASTTTFCGNIPDKLTRWWRWRPCLTLSQSIYIIYNLIIIITSNP